MMFSRPTPSARFSPRLHPGPGLPQILRIAFRIPPDAPQGLSDDSLVRDERTAPSTRPADD